MTRREAKNIAENAHVAAYAVDEVEKIRELRGKEYSEDEEYTSETIYAVNRHNHKIIGYVELDGSFNASTTLAGLHISCVV